MKKFRTLKCVGATLLLMSFGSVCANANLLVDGNFDTPAVTPSFPFYTNYGPVSGDPNYGGLQFDVPGNGWTIIAGNVDLVQQAGGWPAPPQSSPYYLDLNGNTSGTITQTIATTPGQEYALSFYYSNNPGGSPDPATASVTLTSGLFTTVSHFGATTSNLNWVEYLTTFTADGAATTLTFAEDDNPQCCQGGVLLDTVGISAVPESSTWAMMILGFLGVGFMAYRRNGKPSFRVA